MQGVRTPRKAALTRVEASIEKLSEACREYSLEEGRLAEAMIAVRRKPGRRWVHPLRGAGPEWLLRVPEEGTRVEGSSRRKSGGGARMRGAKGGRVRQGRSSRCSGEDSDATRSSRGRDRGRIDQQRASSGVDSSDSSGSEDGGRGGSGGRGGIAVRKGARSDPVRGDASTAASHSVGAPGSKLNALAHRVLGLLNVVRPEFETARPSLLSRPSPRGRETLRRWRSAILSGTEVIARHRGRVEVAHWDAFAAAVDALENVVGAIAKRQGAASAESRCESRVSRGETPVPAPDRRAQSPGATGDAPGDERRAAAAGDVQRRLVRARRWHDVIDSELRGSTHRRVHEVRAYLWRFRQVTMAATGGITGADWLRLQRVLAPTEVEIPRDSDDADGDDGDGLAGDGNSAGAGRVSYDALREAIERDGFLAYSRYDGREFITFRAGGRRFFVDEVDEEWEEFNFSWDGSASGLNSDLYFQGFFRVGLGGGAGVASAPEPGASFALWRGEDGSQLVTYTSPGDDAQVYFCDFERGIWVEFDEDMRSRGEFVLRHLGEEGAAIASRFCADGAEGPTGSPHTDGRTTAAGASQPLSPGVAAGSRRGFHRTCEHHGTAGCVCEFARHGERRDNDGVFIRDSSVRDRDRGGDRDDDGDAFLRNESFEELSAASAVALEDQGINLLVGDRATYTAVGSLFVREDGRVFSSVLIAQPSDADSGRSELVRYISSNDGDDDSWFRFPESWRGRGTFQAADSYTTEPFYGSYDAGEAGRFVTVTVREYGYSASYYLDEDSWAWEPVPDDWNLDSVVQTRPSAHENIELPTLPSFPAAA